MSTDNVEYHSTINHWKFLQNLEEMGWQKLEVSDAVTMFREKLMGSE